MKDEIDDKILEIENSFYTRWIVLRYLLFLIFQSDFSYSNIFLYFKSEISIRLKYKYLLISI